VGVEELVNENSKEKNVKPGKNYNAALGFRWLFVALIAVFFFISSSRSVSTFIFLETLAVTVIYNILITLYILKCSKNGKRTSLLIVYVDIAVISVFSFQTGGINSDAYILYFFLIGCCGLLNNAVDTFGVGIFSVAAYSASCIFALKTGRGEFIYWRLAVKDMLLLMGTFGVTRVNFEVKKYNELHKKEFKLARTDKLTGLANRHYFDQKLSEETGYSDYTGSPLNILMFDLDNFKKFNDTYGHPLGDKLLVLFSDIIKQNIRKTDIPVRYGGEEFLILIRDLDIIIAKSVGDRIRRQLEKQRINIGSGEDRKRVTTSCGIAQYPRHSNDIRKVMECADKALYHAKELGKNTVVTYDDILGS